MPKKPGVLERAKQHYHDTPMRSIVVPEWDDTFYFQPLTVGDIKWAEARSKGKNGVVNEYDRGLYLIIRALKDKDGERVFNAGDMQTLADQVDAEVLTRIGVALNENATVSQDAIDKAKAELQADPTEDSSTQ